MVNLKVKSRVDPIFMEGQEQAMISYDLDISTGVLTVRPEGKLEIQDFQALSKTVDPFIEEKENWRG